MHILDLKLDRNGAILLYMRIGQPGIRGSFVCTVTLDSSRGSFLLHNSERLLKATLHTSFPEDHTSRSQWLCASSSAH